MSGFWQSGSGKAITGKPEDAFLQDFGVIPEGSCAEALIKSFALVEKENKFSNKNDRFYEVKWKLCSGDFKGREVSQKIKCFDGKPEQIDRALNMMRLIMQLCDFKPTHNEAPQDLELVPMLNKVLSIKIGEWSMPKNDGGMIEGNFIREVHASGAIQTETGIKAVVERKPTSSVESAFSRNAAMPELEADLPF
jgi:hypothetical protein